MNGKRYAMYVHPWDLLDDGPENVLSYLHESGIDTINIASSYHTGRFILPHNRKRTLYTPEEGVVYFDFDESYFRNTRIKPIRSGNFHDRDVLQILSERAGDFNVDVASWTVMLHNSSFTSKYPELAIVDPFGNASENYLCPNRGDVRNYMAALSANIAGSYGVSAVQLEASLYPSGLAHGNHHENFGVAVEPVVSYLFSMCYCITCKSKAAESGFNLDSMIPEIRKHIRRSLNSERGKNGEEVNGITSGEIEEKGFGKLLEFKKQNVTEILLEISDAVREYNQEASLEIISGSTTGYNEGVELGELPGEIDGVDLITYFPEKEEIVRTVRKAIEMTGGRNRIYPVIRITEPTVSEISQIRETVSSLSHLDTGGLNVYNYGWATEARLDALATAIRDIKTS